VKVPATLAVASNWAEPSAVPEVMFAGLAHVTVGAGRRPSEVSNIAWTCGRLSPEASSPSQ
jgi:hypothetical protein